MYSVQRSPILYAMQPAHAQRAHALDLVQRYGWNAMASQILNPGIDLWFSDDANAVIGYVVRSGVRVVAGEPVCAAGQRSAVVAAFQQEARSHRQKVCYFGAEEPMALALADHGPVASLLIGAQPVWEPHCWPAILRRKASLRAQVRRAANKQVSVSRWSSARATNHPELRWCLEQWLQQHGLPPMRFLVEPYTLSHLEHRRIYVAQQQQHVIGFLIASPVPLRRGWLIEQIVRGHGAPNGTSELLIDSAMRDLAADGSRYVTLGLSPLSQRAGITVSPQPFWLTLLLRWVRAHGRRFYNFDGLDAFKAKFSPDMWQPIYLMAQDSVITPHTIYAIAAAFSGISPIWFVWQGLQSALQQEWQWFWQQQQQHALKRYAGKTAPIRRLRGAATETSCLSPQHC
ncbi:MAG: DUF2156 domain-containing protein [Chloroflexaceae bacterium]|nr:DUF2156 domain-containing protein [Chloroflexaceae bacterium]